MQITATLKKTEGSNYPRNIIIVAFISINTQSMLLYDVFISDWTEEGRINIKNFEIWSMLRLNLWW